MSETLVTELLRFCKTRCGIDLDRCSGPRDLLAAELGMLKCLVAAGRAAMQRWCEQVGDGYVGARATRGDVRYRFVGRRQKAIPGLFGVITLVRAYYAPLGGGGKGWVPLAEQLGIGGGYTPGCEYFMARLCAEQSYEQGLAQFHEVFRSDGREKVSMNKAFEMVRAVTDGLEEQRRREIVEHADGPVEVREEITGTMVVSIDAGKVPVRANERVTEDGKKSYDRVFRDSKVATVSTVKVDREGAAHCTNQRCQVSAAPAHFHLDPGKELVSMLDPRDTTRPSSRSPDRYHTGGMHPPAPARSMGHYNGLSVWYNLALERDLG